MQKLPLKMEHHFSRLLLAVLAGLFPSSEIPGQLRKQMDARLSVHKLKTGTPQLRKQI